MPDLTAIRSLFPHTQQGIYMNHAATGPLSAPVVAAIEAYLQERHLTHIENYFAMEPVIAKTIERVGRLIGVEADRVAFAPNTSYGLNILAEGLDWQPGDRVAIPGCEFPANVYPFLNQRDRGVEVDFIPHRDGVFSVDDVAATLTPRTRVVSVSWVQFLSGFRCDLAAIGALCRERGIVFCVDAIQGLGALRLDVREAGVDFLACGGHKWLMATQGIGFVYLTEALQARIRPMAGWLHGPVDWAHLTDYRLAFHPTARRFLLGTSNSIGIVALHATLGLYADAGPAWCEAQVLERSRSLRQGLEDRGFTCSGTPDPHAASGIVTIRHPDAASLYEALSQQRIQVALRDGQVRFAPTYYNTDDEARTVLDAVDAWGAGG